MHKITTRNMMDNMKILSSKDIHLTEYGGFEYVVIFGCSEISGMEMDLGSQIDVDIDFIEHQGSPYYSMYINSRNKNIYFLLPLLEQSKTISEIGRGRKILVSSQIVLEKVFEPENLYVGSLVIDADLVKNQHLDSLHKISADPNISSKLKQELGIADNSKEIGLNLPQEITLRDFEINDFEQCMYVHVPLRDISTSTIHISFETHEEESFCVILKGPIFLVTLQLCATSLQQIYDDNLNICFKFEDSEDLIVEYSAISNALGL